MSQVTGLRAARKQQTRQALLDAALRLLDRHSLSGLSLREVTRAAGVVPAAFYRHFPDLESLGVALVEESLEPLRATLRTVRAGLTDSGEIIRRSVDVLAQQVGEHRDLFRFIARERHGGVPRVRAAIREQLRESAEELARDLSTSGVGGVIGLAGWPPDDVRMFTGLVVNQMVLTAAALLEPPDAAGSERLILDTATAQLHLIVLGARHWRDA